MKCEYGCETEANTQLKNGRWCCAARPSGCTFQRLRNATANKLARAAGQGGYNYNDLNEETKSRMSRKGTFCFDRGEIFIEGKEWGSEFLRKYIHHFEVLEYKCAGEECGITEWKKQHLTLELDHINGIRTDNREGNIRWLCPNCHSQTPTFRGYNKSLNGKKKVSDDELLTALRDCSNIRQALQKVGLAAKGGNYERASKLLKK